MPRRTVKAAGGSAPSSPSSSSSSPAAAPPAPSIKPKPGSKIAPCRNTRGPQAATGRRARSELPMNIYLGRGKGSRCIYIYIQSHTFPPRKRLCEHILHEISVLLFKSSNGAPRGSLQRAGGWVQHRAAASAPSVVDEASQEPQAGQQQPLGHLKNTGLDPFSPSARGAGWVLSKYISKP